MCSIFLFGYYVLFENIYKVLQGSSTFKQTKKTQKKALAKYHLKIA